MGVLFRKSASQREGDEREHHKPRGVNLKRNSESLSKPYLWTSHPPFTRENSYSPAHSSLPNVRRQANRTLRACARISHAERKCWEDLDLGRLNPNEDLGDSTLKAAKVRITEIVKGLKEAYPDARCALDHKSPLELLVATMLSAQCTDVRVNQVTPTLFQKYPSAQDLAGAAQSNLERIIHSTGFFRNKAKNIKAACQRIISHFSGDVPKTMEELLSLPGVARKTANVVLGTAYGISSGVVVDTHVFRIAHRLGLTRGKTPEKVELDLMKLLPREEWIDFSHRLIHHGRRICMARNPQCTSCRLDEVCPKLGVESKKTARRH